MSPHLPTPEAEALVEAAVAFWRKFHERFPDYKSAGEAFTRWRAFCESLPDEKVDLTKYPSAFREAYAARVAEELLHFEGAIEASRSLLVELAKKGAEPVYVLSLLMRFATARGTEPPRVITLTFQPQDFDLKLPGGFPSQLHALDAYARGKPVPARLQASRAILREPAHPRKRGPEGVGVSAYMALLAHHFQETTGWHQYRAIGELVPLWCPWLRGGGGALTAENVRRRVNRAERTDWFKSLEKEWAEKYRRGLLKGFQGPRSS